ncbi:Asp23/Gls24 family envelope stress response protein [Streptomyces sp. NPDC050703]|uniref:Asp23/Gls24 family envelope stress response protein n=1 Tax=Streptomyces sp. NPDC050703 TaxID=3157218 RepID=UPI00341D87E8
MTEQPGSGELTEAVGRAVLATPGVAFLRPGLAQLVRASRTLARVRPASGGPSYASGVRVTRDAGAWHAEVHVVLRRGHRAVDVTREVRAAVADAVRRTAATPGAPGVGEPRVTVTVTGLV